MLIEVTGNACWGDVYQNKGVNTSLLKTCPDIGPDVIECQQTYGKKIFLSIGGGSPTDYYIKNAASGKSFASFLWAAFGPASATKTNVPRPWGDAGVDGFDFDIENLMDPAPQKNYQTSGYVAMINQFKNVLFKQDTTKSYYISGAPQCPIPDSHLSVALANAWFDFFYIQFYNTASCSARAGIQKLAGKGTNDISYAKWTTQTSKNPNVKMYIGLPGSKTAAIDPSYYLTPAEAQKLVNSFYANKKFGGIMVWEATAAQNQTPCGVDYGTWMKDILTAKAAGKTFPTNTKTCAGVSSKRSLFESVVEDVGVVEKRGGQYTVVTTGWGPHETTQTRYPSVPAGYYIPSSVPVAAGSSSSVVVYSPSSAAAVGSSAAAYASSAPIYATVTKITTKTTTVCPCESASAPSGYESSSAQGLTVTSVIVNTVTPYPLQSSAAPTAPYPVGGGNGTAWGTASASASYPSSSYGWGVPATGDASVQGFSVLSVVVGSVFALFIL